MSRAGRAVVLALAAAALLAAAPPDPDLAAARAWRASFGIVAFDWRGDTAARVAALGVGVVRGSCDWSALEPARGVYDWRCADALVGGARLRRVRVYLTVSCTPSWSSGAPGCSHLPADVTDWYDFVEQFVSRYAGADTILGVFNEPNLEITDEATGDAYALLFANASNARNRVDPRFAIAGPETSHHALASGYYQRVMNRLTSLRAFDPQDIVAVHWYPDGPPLPQYLDAIHAVAGTQPVWLTETGMSTPDFGEQAAFYDRVIDAFAASGRPWWTHVIFYRLWDGTDCCSEAITRGDFSPKPAFDRFRAWLAAPAEPREPVQRRSGGGLQ